MGDKGRYYFDIESNGLLDDSTVDYSASPWKLRDSFVVHCIVATNIDTLEVVSFVQEECYTKFKQWAISNVNEIVSHNGVNFDMLVCKVVFGMDYTVTPDTWCGKPVVIHDTLIMSKVLNPDRRGHSIEYFGKLLGFPKIDWRAKAVELGLIAWNASKGSEFHTFHPAMRDYCEQDVLVGVKTFQYLLQEWGDWPWQEAYDLEKAIAEIITRQAHRGFYFDKELALANVKELDELMLERKERVEPNLPQKPLGKTKAKEYIPGKEQFKKNGEPNANVIKWCEKHGGSIEQREDGYYTTLLGKEYKLPIPQEPIVSTEPTHIDDTTFIKGVLVKMGWSPTQYKERDLTVDTKKQKLSEDKFVAVIDRYVTQTLESPFCKDRCAKLSVSPAMLKAKLLKHKLEKPLKVYTNPTFTVGQEKEIDPELGKLAKKFPYVQDIIEYLTYKHRRNSILGGGFDPEEDDEDEFESGFLPNVRQDGRIPTPADSCGCATGRMQHRLVSNIPRVSSLYGDKMRGLFGVDTDLCYQHAYDFASLEARIESHYCWKYDETKEYCNSLLLEKPNDVHCYSEDTKVLTLKGWKIFGDLSHNEAVAQWSDGKIEFVIPTDIIWEDYIGDMIEISGARVSQLITPNHRVIYNTDKVDKYRVMSAQELLNVTQVYIPAGGLYECNTVESIEPHLLRLIVATQADGYLNKDCSAITFTFTKRRKIDRLKSILNAGDIAYSEHASRTLGREDEVTIRILAGKVANSIRSWLSADKKLTWRLLNLTKDQMRVVVDEVKYWDGTSRKDGSVILDTTCIATRDILYTLNQISGGMSYCSTYTKQGTFAGTTVIHRLFISNSAKTRYGTNGLASKVKYKGKIGCVTVPSGFILTKKDDCIVVSGNSVTARKISEMLGREFTRTPAKSVKYACSYGAQAARIAKTVGCSLEDGQTVFDGFWQAAEPLAKLKEALTRYWETVGEKKFVLGLDGRKIMTRSQHALLNSLFQSAGVICAKRTMLIQDRLTKEQGYAVDFWKEDWKNKEYVQQLIAYHDEAQSEITKSLVKWKKVEEEDVEQFKHENPTWAGTIHSDKGLFMGHSVADDILQEAIEQTNKYYKLKVPLAVEPMYGRNWRECH